MTIFHELKRLSKWMEIRNSIYHSNHLVLNTYSFHVAQYTNMDQALDDCIYCPFILMCCLCLEFMAIYICRYLILIVYISDGVDCIQNRFEVYFWKFPHFWANFLPYLMIFESGIVCQIIF